MSNVEISKHLSKNLIFGPPVERLMGEVGKIFFHQKTLILFLGKVKKCGSEGTMP